MNTILFIVDIADIDSELQKQLQILGYSVIVSNSKFEGISILKEYPSIDIIIIDLDMKKGLDGLEIAEMILEDRDLPIIFMSDKTDEDIVYQIEDVKSYGFIIKNSPAAVFHTSIRMALDLFNTHSKLKESEEKYKLAFQTSPDAVNINELDGRYVDTNNGFTALTGYTREDVIGRLSSEIKIWTIPEDRERLVEELKDRGKVDNLESIFRCKDGSLKTALMSARIISLNSIPHILSITRDITERKIIEEKLEKSDKLHRTIIQTNVDGYLLINKNNKIIDTNHSYCELSGYSREELIGMPAVNLIANETADRYFSRVQEITRKRHMHFNSVHKRKDGSPIPVNVSVSAFNADSEENLVIFVRDISQ